MNRKKHVPHTNNQSLDTSLAWCMLRHRSEPNSVGTAERSCRKAHLTAFERTTKGLLAVRCSSVFEMGVRRDQRKKVNPSNAGEGGSNLINLSCGSCHSWWEWNRVLEVISPIWRQFSADWDLDMEKLILQWQILEEIFFFFQLTVTYTYIAPARF